MLEKTGNIWDQKCDALVITTNGSVKRDGNAVMGRGCALEAKEKFPYLPFILGERLEENNRAYAFSYNSLDMNGEGNANFYWLVTFPVKHHWREQADLELIDRSVRQLRCVTEAMFWQKVVLPQPGCGNGGRDWETEVRPILAKYLDDKYEVFTW